MGHITPPTVDGTGGEAFDPIAFVRECQSATSLVSLAVLGWRVYYAAKNRLDRLASDALPPEQAPAVASYLVQAARVKALEPFNLEELRIELEGFGVTAVRLLVQDALILAEKDAAAAKAAEHESSVSDRVDGGEVESTPVAAVSGEVVHEAGVDSGKNPGNP